MNPFYRDAVKAVTLAKMAHKWIGTPFRKGASIKGAGVDCVNLANCIYADSGFDADFDQRTVKYSLDGGQHSRESKLALWLRDSKKFARTEGGELMIGDLLVFRMRENGVAWHCGLVVSANIFVHAMKPHGVVAANTEDPTWKRRIEGVYRPIV